MALQSEVSPPLVGDANKDTKIDGDTKSTDENESSQSTDEDVDLEEGEILDSGAEEEEEKKDFTNSSLKEALDKSCLQSIEQLISQSKNLETSVPKPSKPISPRKLQNKLAAKYLDHDQIQDNSDQEDGWYPSPSKYKPKFEEKPIDYRMELAAYRGTPPSSPDHKKKDEKRKKRSSKKSKKTSRKTIKRKDIKGMRVMKYKKESVKGRICKFFKEGKCAKGADCLFSHASPTSYKKKELCKFYLNGHCNKGKECLYMHSEFPCKFYHTGSECYAKEDCRFSHAPLTDEMKRILADYLKLHHGDDDHEGRKRRVSSSPEPKGSAPKRPCLLGSPPRHIREAEETKRWQEEMKLLQQQNHPGFEIRISPNRESSSPPQCPKPNFYQETLPSTPPQKRRTAPEASTPLAHPSGFPQSSAFNKSNNSGMFIEGSPKIYQYDEEYAEEMDVSSAKQDTSNDFSWKNVHNLVHIPDQQELDFTSDVKFDETTQFSEMESSTDCPPVLSPGPTVPSTVENKDTESNDASNQETSKTGDDGIPAVATSNSSSDPPAPPIVIPSHLPRKQRELFMRIQQHQKKNAVITENVDISNSPSNVDIAEPQIKKEDSEVEDEKPETDKTDSKWYSSEDDDDDADQPLTDVLKKLRQTPPPVAKEPESKPTVNLMEMLNKIQKNTLERNKAAVDTKPPQDNFWQNILLGSVPSSQPLIPALSTVSSEPKRRTLLPDPQPLPVPAVKKEPVVPKDPRLKNRDPRTLANSNASNNAANIPKTTASETNNLLLNTPPVQDIKSLLSKTTSIISEPPKENIPYRLHGIYTTPPNYTPYIHASQSNPKLLDDPRLRKHLNLTQSNESSFKISKDLDTIKSEPKDVPPIPKSLLKYEKLDSLNINIFETSSLKSSNEDAQDCKPKPPIMRKLIDPRIRRRDSHSNSGSDTPPHLTIVETSTTPPPLQEFKTAPILENALLDPVFEKKWLPPVLEKNWTPPVLEKNLYNVVIKKEIDSDSEDSPDPPRLEISESPIETISMSSKKEETVKSEESVSDKDKSVPPLVPPLIIKRGKPTPASHLPKAIADPRMAKLHHPLDPRRPRAAFADSNSKVIVERKKVNQTENERPPDKISINELKSSGDLSLTKNESKETVTAVEIDDKQKTVKNIPKKSKLSEKNEEKKKTVHRNRKSSMDYASPLNSCDDTNSNKSLNYNSYNQRPNQRTVKPITDTESLTSSTSSSAPEVSENTIISDYLLSDNSNIESDNIDVNLKDMFKTIDPTASPFC